MALLSSLPLGDSFPDNFLSQNLLAFQRMKIRYYSISILQK